MPINVSLVMFKADGTRRDFPVTREKIVVGRKHDCDLRIPLTSVSRKHCEVQVDNQQIKMRDLGSSNGTYHNNIRVEEANLSAGDEVVIGPVVFTIVVDGQPEEIKPVRTILDDSSQAQSNHGQGSETQTEHASLGAHQGDQGRSKPLTQAQVDQNAPTVDLENPGSDAEPINSTQANDASGSHLASDVGGEEIEILDDDQTSKG